MNLNIKNIYYLTIAVLFSSCISNKTTVLNTNDRNSSKASTFQLEKGWDIYDGGGYRYGPSIMLDKKGTIHAWFATPGSIHGLDKLHYKESAKETPFAMKAEDVVSQKFNSEKDFFAIAVRCPSWNSKNSRVTLSLYAWKGDYQKTIASDPVNTKLFDNYEDNQFLTLSWEKKYSAGTYLWVLSNPKGKAGVWEKEGIEENVNAFINGVPHQKSFMSFLMYNPSNGVTYWDQVSYKKSNDSGRTWTQEKMVLKPTEGSRDQFSICDPAVIKIGKYYYLGYTSTEDIRMIFNHAYIARSTSPEGPWQKWDGNKWGTNPQPIVTFDGHKDAWGAGEPSMVVKNDSLFFYYTWRDKGKQEIRVAVANAKNENWPSTLKYMGVALDQSKLDKVDHGDVKYRPDLNKFQLLHTASRLSKDSYLMLWESSDGLNFNKVADIKNLAEPFLHNCGWSANEIGHQEPSKPQFVSYGYGPNWGEWNTKWHPIQFDKK